MSTYTHTNTWARRAAPSLPASAGVRVLSDTHPRSPGAPAPGTGLGTLSAEEPEGPAGRVLPPPGAVCKAPPLRHPQGGRYRGQFGWSANTAFLRTLVTS